MNIHSLFHDCPVVPVVTVSDAASAVPLAQALYDGGIRAIEITFRSAAAPAAIRSVAERLPDMLVGAGSVRSLEFLQEAQDAGAAFCVSPGMTPALLDAAREAEMPLVPGVATASEIMQAMECGYTFLKFFPAETNGGVAALKSLAAPLPEIRFFPTGGINATNLRDYLQLDPVVCVGGSWFVPGPALAAGDFELISREAAAARTLAE